MRNIEGKKEVILIIGVECLFLNIFIGLVIYWFFFFRVCLFFIFREGVYFELFVV